MEGFRVTRLDIVAMLRERESERVGERELERENNRDDHKTR